MFFEEEQTFRFWKPNDFWVNRLSRYNPIENTSTMHHVLRLLKNDDTKTSMYPNKIRCGNFGLHQHKMYKRGDFVYVTDDKSDRIFFLIEGRIKIGAYGSENKEITKAILTKGEVFGELALLDEKHRNDFAFVMEDCILCVVKAVDVLEQMDYFLIYNLMKIVGTRLVDMEKRLESLMFQNSRTRVINFLLDFASKKGHRVGFEIEVRKFITHQEIANLTSTSRQTVTTLLNNLRDRHILTYDRRRLLIRNMHELEQEAMLPME
jgi:CRP-like cAMP-binding protein